MIFKIKKSESLNKKRTEYLGIIVIVLLIGILNFYAQDKDLNKFDYNGTEQKEQIFVETVVLEVADKTIRGYEISTFSLFTNKDYLIKLKDENGPYDGITVAVSPKEYDGYEQGGFYEFVVKTSVLTSKKISQKK